MSRKFSSKLVWGGRGDAIYSVLLISPASEARGSQKWHESWEKKFQSFCCGRAPPPPPPHSTKQLSRNKPRPCPEVPAARIGEHTFPIPKTEKIACRALVVK